ncbi:MAG: hypothetical protein AAFS10_00545 [Myxococcota bacterium]
MLVRAQHIRQIIHERVEVRRTEPINRNYRVAIRLAMLMSAMPATLILFMCILHIPMVPVIGLFFILWLVLKMSDQVTLLAFRWVWPIHSRLLLVQNPARTDIFKRREVETRHSSARIELDPITARLQVVDHTIDLTQPYTLHLEWAEPKEGDLQLRLRFFQEGISPLILGTRLNPDQHRAWAEDLDRLPRHEGDVYLLEFGAMHAMLAELHPLHASTQADWPPILTKLQRWLPTPSHAQQPVPVLRERRAQNRKLSGTNPRLPAVMPATSKRSRNT